ncbi:MAG: Sb-PDE family phosphodiesterase [Bacteroidales bacterium]|nr:Sb-PDE family phosphodiesterase [Bacteroidales bacterium]
MKLKPFLILLLVCISLKISAQEELSNKYTRPSSPAAYPYQARNILIESRQPLYLPEVEGYTLLKCDFHLHTVFSDGSVWPVTRVEEAFHEGLDAISITDHFEFRSINDKDVNTSNLTREYEIAKATANELGVLLIPGLEVTREVPTGHFNMLFINDPSPLVKYINKENPRDPSNIEDILAAGKELGAFITWNHPGYQKPNGAEWTPIHESLYKKGLIMGIEIINSGMYIPLVHKWADEKGLTKMTGTDQHNGFYLRDGHHRAMTIVFARERSAESIKKALLAGNTVGYAYNYMYGDRKFLEPVFQNSLKTRVLRNTDTDIAIEIRNTSGMPYEIELLGDDSYRPDRNNKITLYGNETIAVLMNKNGNTNESVFHVIVNNLQIKAGKPLNTFIKF